MTTPAPTFTTVAEYDRQNVRYHWLGRTPYPTCGFYSGPAQFGADVVRVGPGRRSRGAYDYAATSVGWVDASLLRLSGPGPAHAPRPAPEPPEVAAIKAAPAARG